MVMHPDKGGKKLLKVIVEHFYEERRCILQPGLLCSIFPYNTFPLSEFLKKCGRSYTPI